MDEQLEEPDGQTASCIFFEGTKLVLLWSPSCDRGWDATGCVAQIALIQSDAAQGNIGPLHQAELPADSRHACGVASWAGYGLHKEGCLRFGFRIPAGLVRAMGTRTEYDTFGPLEVPDDK